MPELKLFGRRWHTATDLAPLMAAVLGAFHLVWFVIFWFGTYTLETTGLKYICDEAGLLRAANYSLLFLFFISAAVEWAIVGVGLRGGPLEPDKRWAMSPLLYLQVVLWALLFCATIFGTFIVASPHIGEGCWQANPCAELDSMEGFPNLAACKFNNGSRSVQSTTACQEVFGSIQEYSDCYEDWFQYGYGWNASGRGWSSSSECRKLDINTDGSSYNDEGEPTGVTDTPSDGTTPSDLASLYQALLLNVLEVKYDINAVSSAAPWWFCFGGMPSCQRLLSAGDQCDQWDVLDDIKVDPDSKKAFFDGLIYSSWGMLAITGLAVYLTFNSFPEFSEVDSWEGTLKGMANTCCCASNLDSTASSSGDPASREIARSLHMLFGGVDLDPSDRLLGMYLVSEQQTWRRQKHALQALQAAGIVRSSKQPGVVLRAWRRLAVAVRGASVTVTKGSPAIRSSAAASAALKPSSRQQSSQATAEAPIQATPKAALAAGPAAGNLAARAASKADGLGPAAGQLPGPSALPASPFDCSADNLEHPLGSRTGSASSSMATSQRPTNPALSSARQLQPRYRHTLLRLRTGVFEAVTRAATGGASGRQGQQQQLQLAVAEEGKQEVVEQQQEEEEEEGGGGKSLDATGEQELASKVGSSGSTGNGRRAWKVDAEVDVRLAQCYRPMLTPSGCARELPITPQQAADIYTGYHEPVPRAVLLEARRISKFAVGAYGLQAVWWGKGKPPAACMGNVNMLLRCLGKPLGIENKFRKRNLNAIVEVTGVPPSDLLYVSYANAPGGVLPYMILLDRQSKSVVVAVRGTVGMEDLITDLLSTPLDVGGWLPDWVNEANTDGKPLFAHLGIVSSATAILKDLEDRGLLKELLYSELAKERCSASSAFHERFSTASVLDAVRQAGTALSTKLAFWQAAQRDKLGADLGSQSSEQVQLGDGGCKRVDQGELEEGAAKEDSDAEPDLVGMGAHAEVHLSLARAQTLIRSKLQSEGWRVVVTGHSLGAAVACMLSFHLKDIFPDLHCWAFNPPGGLLSWELSQLARRFCTSIVVGKDVISRLTFSTSKRLVDDMVVSLARCKRPKLVVLADLVLRRRSGADATPATFCAYKDMSDAAVQALEGYYKTSVLHAGEQVEMYPPGRLVFLRPFKGKKAKQTVWDAVWIEAAALIDEGILVSPSMMSHHRVFVMRDALRSALEGEAAEAEQGVAVEEEVVLDRV